jgi:ribosomal protein S18 acetylase RimI-like enzyme
MITIRPPKQDDSAFIISSWVSSFQQQLDPFVTIKTVAKSYRPHIERCLSKSSILVACLTDDPDCIIGYIAFDDEAVHYCYVKYACRRQGIATKLLDQAEKLGKCKMDTVTHYPIWVAKKLDRFKDRFTIDPYIFFK